MTQATAQFGSMMPPAGERPSRGAGPHTLVAAMALGASLSVGVWILGTPHDVPSQVSPVPSGVAAVRSRPAPAAQARPAPRAAPYDALLDPAYSLGPAPVALADSAPRAAPFSTRAPVIVAALDPAEAEPAAVVSDRADAGAHDATAAPVIAAVPASPIAPAPPAMPALADLVPLPIPRPHDASPPPAIAPMKAASRRFAAGGRRGGQPVVVVDNRSFFEKLFGAPATPSPGLALAYAAPEEGGFDNARRLTAGPPIADNRHTAVYDIAAHTVYMPDGSRLEAHSGLGRMLDDPGSVHERNRGATPPTVYQLSAREAPFHGVSALRLNPVDASSTFGRTGLLAHTYMLGPNGDSNGCVSFRDYGSFLQAYRNGQVTRLSVIARN